SQELCVTDRRWLPLTRGPLFCYRPTAADEATLDERVASHIFALAVVEQWSAGPPASTAVTLSTPTSGLRSRRSVTAQRGRRVSRTFFIVRSSGSTCGSFS